MSVVSLNESKWIDVGAGADIPRQGARVVTTPQGNIAVFRSLDDQYFALLDACPHRGGPLSQGIVHGCKVTCPLHGWHVDMITGSAIAPDVGQVRTFPVKVEGERVWLQLN